MKHFAVDPVVWVRVCPHKFLTVGFAHRNIRENAFHADFFDTAIGLPD
jgi:hypothetical protein